MSANLQAMGDACTMAVARADVACDVDRRYNMSLEVGTNGLNSSRVALEASKGSLEVDGQATASHSSVDLGLNDFAFGLSHVRRLNPTARVQARYFAELRYHISELVVRTTHDLGKGATLSPSCSLAMY